MKKHNQSLPKTNRRRAVPTAHNLAYRRAIAATLLLMGAGTGIAADNSETNAAPQSLRSMSIEELMSVKVTSVSKTEERLSETAAAITVVTQEDIRRSGATLIPEVLRMVPGVNVGRVNAHEWAVGVRGLNQSFNSSLLTLIDGRSIYTPLFAGTIWQSEDVLLDDVDRIEVIRGPGSTVWGANAFNGVVNIVTKPASETQGLLVSAGSGSEQTVASAIRYGGQIGSDTHYRVYGKFDDWCDSTLWPSGTANDGWYKGQGGFRIDGAANRANKFTLQGDLYYFEANQQMPQVSTLPPYDSSIAGKWDQLGANLLSRWTHDFDNGSDLAVQTYYDLADMKLPIVHDTEHAVDLDIRHHFHWGDRQEIVWGGGYRVTLSHFVNSYEVTLADQNRMDQIGNAFVQDEFTLFPDRLKLTAGTKLEYNNITGLEVQPGGRITWTPAEKQTVWASVSRAVRTPSAFENDGTIHLTTIPPGPFTGPFPTLITYQGNSDFKSEELMAYELGYRIEPHPRVSVDLAAFAHSYRGLRWTSDSTDMSAVPNYVQVISRTDNSAGGETYGGELSVTWQPVDSWRLNGSYSLLESRLKGPPSAVGGSSAPSTEAAEHQISLRSSLDITRDIEFDAWLRYVGEVDKSGAGIPGSTVPANVPEYITLDVRVAWRPVKNLEVSVVGQNLADSPHREFNPSYYSTEATMVSRSVFGKLTWKF